jgi:hypothetical protein
MRAAGRLTAALATVLLTGLAGCGDRSTLRAERVEPPPEFTQTGLKDDSSTPGRPRIADTPYWRYEDLSDGDELTWTITVRNTGEETVRVVGVRSDPTREKVLRPRELAGEAVTIEPTRTADIEVRGEIFECDQQNIEVLYGTGTTELEIESPPGKDAGTDVVDLNASFEIASDAAC